MCRIINILIIALWLALLTCGDVIIFVVGSAVLGGAMYLSLKIWGAKRIYRQLISMWDFLLD